MYLIYAHILPQKDFIQVFVTINTHGYKGIEYSVLLKLLA